MKRLTSNSPFWLMLVTIAITLSYLFIPSNGWLQLVTGTLLVLVLPGWSLTEALFARQVISRPERLLFTLLSSLGIVGVGTVLLNQLPWGLQTTLWLAVSISVTLVSSALALLLQLTSANASQPTAHAGSWGRMSFVQGAALTIALVVACYAVSTARTPVSASGYVGYTMLWMVPAQTGDVQHIELGISSQVFDRTRYGLRLLIDDEVAQEWPAIELAPNERWAASLAVPTDLLGRQTLKAELYRLDAPDIVYRNVALRLAE